MLDAVVDERRERRLPDTKVLEFERVREPLEEPFPATEYYRSDDDRQFVDFPSGEGLADRVSTTHDIDVLLACRGLGSFERLV
jgi:hypothetical protein